MAPDLREKVAEAVVLLFRMTVALSASRSCATGWRTCNHIFRFDKPAELIYTGATGLRAPCPCHLIAAYLYYAPFKLCWSCAAHSIRFQFIWAHMSAFRVVLDFLLAMSSSAIWITWKLEGRGFSVGDTWRVSADFHALLDLFSWIKLLTVNIVCKLTVELVNCGPVEKERSGNHGDPAKSSCV